VGLCAVCDFPKCSSEYFIGHGEDAIASLIDAGWVVHPGKNGDFHGVGKTYCPQHPRSINSVPAQVKEKTDA
jgi:hypothetical protein